MTTAAASLRPGASPAATSALAAAARFWFVAMVGGQALFLYYIVVFYGPATVTGHFEGWRRNHNLVAGYVAGDTVGNLSFAAHVLLAAVVTFGGVLQLVPQIRTRAPAVHRWIGRAFLGSAMAAAVAGLYGVWMRGGSVDFANTIAITIDAVLILAFGAHAWRLALRREFALHRRWALRTFMVANGVFFLRLGLVAYGLIAKLAGPILPGPERFFDVWTFGCYLVPLAALELYFRAQAQAGPRGRLATAGVITTLTVLMSVGAVGAWFAFYAPVLANL